MQNLPTWAQTLAVFDTETTGVDTADARIVTATVAVLDATGTVTERHDWIIDPGVEIPAAAAAVHGITTERARADGMNAAAAVAQIAERLQEVLERGIPIVAYNAPYDFTILQNEVRRHGVTSAFVPSAVVDPLVLDRELDRFRKGKRTLVDVISVYGVAIAQAHDAGEDAIAAGRLAQRIAAKYHAQLPDGIEELHATQIAYAKRQAESFADWMRANRDPKFVASTGWPVYATGD